MVVENAGAIDAAATLDRQAVNRNRMAGQDMQDPEGGVLRRDFDQNRRTRVDSNVGIDRDLAAGQGDCRASKRVGERNRAPIARGGDPVAECTGPAIGRARNEIRSGGTRRKCRSGQNRTKEREKDQPNQRKAAEGWAHDRKIP